MAVSFRGLNHNFNGGTSMKILVLILMAGFLVAGCASFNHSENIGTDPQGNAVGTYSLSSQGPYGEFRNAYSFARAIAMINYSKSLRTIRYDEAGGILEYDFNQAPIGRQSSAATTTGQGCMPSSFGHQPIQ